MNEGAEPASPSGFSGAGVQTAEEGSRSGPYSSLDSVEERVAWRTSDEYKRFLRYSVIWSCATILLALGLGLLITRALNNPDLGIHVTGMDYLDNEGFAVLIWALCASVGILIYWTRARSSFQDHQILSRARRDLMQAEDDVAIDGSLDFLSLWSVTQKRLDYYHRIATTHAERSFLYGQIAAASGFAVIVIAAIIAAFARSTEASVASAITGVAGGGLGAYIGATFMRSQDVASVQLREYFHQPLEFSKFLAAERLLEQLSEGDRTSATQQVIEAIVSANGPTG